MQKVHNHVNPLLLKKANFFFHDKKADTFLVHCKCGSILCLLFRAPFPFPFLLYLNYEKERHF